MTSTLESTSAPVNPRRPGLPALVVGLVAAVVSIGRLWLFDRSAPTEVLWAEDGLFPLCIRKADFFTCLADPFAGYLLFLPRVLAWPVAVLPWEHWALAANVIAAVLAGVTAALAFVVVRRAGFGWFTSVGVGLLPVLAPMAGLEAINAIGSSYMLLLFLATLMIVLPPKSGSETSSKMYLMAGAALLLLTALTIPSAVVLLGLLLIMVVRGHWRSRTGVLWGFALLTGLAAQGAVALTASEPRNVAVGLETIRSWVDATPVALLTYVPGVSIGEYSLFFNFTYAPSPFLGWISVLVLLMIGLVLIFHGNQRNMSAGLLVVAGLLFGMIPSVLAGAGNRYFVVPLVLWGSALLLALDDRIRKSSAFLLAFVVAVIAIVWWPAMAASPFRATPAPAWTLEVDRVTAECRSDPAIITRVTFSHFWPPGQGEVLTEPTTDVVPCTTVWRWID